MVIITAADNSRSAHSGSSPVQKFCFHRFPVAAKGPFGSLFQPSLAWLLPGLYMTRHGFNPVWQILLFCLELDLERIV